MTNYEINVEMKAGVKYMTIVGKIKEISENSLILTCKKYDKDKKKDIFLKISIDASENPDLLEGFEEGQVAVAEIANKGGAVLKDLKDSGKWDIAYKRNDGSFGVNHIFVGKARQLTTTKSGKSVRIGFSINVPDDDPDSQYSTRFEYYTIYAVNSSFKKGSKTVKVNNKDLAEKLLTDPDEVVMIRTSELVDNIDENGTVQTKDDGTPWQSCFLQGIQTFRDKKNSK